MIFRFMGKAKLSFFQVQTCEDNDPIKWNNVQTISFQIQFAGSAL